mgnify:CR=1 FL=1
MENDDINLVVNATNTNAAAGGNALDESRVGTNGLQTKGVHVWFGKHHVLEDISLDFPANSVSGLIGPSGCGKTSLLHIAGLLEAPSSGEVYLNNQKINWNSDKDLSISRLRDIGFIFQFNIQTSSYWK